MTPRKRSTGLQRLGWILMVGLALASVFPLSAAGKKEKEDRSTSRSISGIVQDEAEKPVGNAVVHLKDTKSLQIRSYITRETGEYQFQGLNPDIDYELQAQFQGASSNSKRLSSFDSRKHAIMNLKLEKK